MELKPLVPADKRIFSRYLNLAKHELSVYAFENIYIWKKLFNIYWKVIQGYLCVFFQDQMGCFLYLSPLGEQLREDVLREAFCIMDGFNRNKEVSRIENIEERDLNIYQNFGYDCFQKSCDYLCRRQNLMKLAGNDFKSKRASVNYFIKHYDFNYLTFTLAHKNSCIKLYNLWMKQRLINDPVYQGMLRDNRHALQVLLDNWQYLDCRGSLVEVNKKIKAFSFGFRLNRDTFCVLYEITDLSIKGLAQFIFREFSKELEGYKYINIMDDSGLENLKRVKLSYHPVRLIPAFIAKRKL